MCTHNIYSRIKMKFAFTLRFTSITNSRKFAFYSHHKINLNAINVFEEKLRECENDELNIDYTF